MSILETRNLSFKYNLGNTYVLKNINFSVEQGEIVTICGSSGCGKTTFLKHFKSAIAPYGEVQGNILYQDRNLQGIGLEEQTRKIGYVSQIADNQIVTDKVYHELAFGLESLAYENQTIRLRVAEMASFFGLESLFYRDVSELSGGQKQLLTLASVMSLKPEIIILDEPTSQLDPIAAGEFINMVLKINRDFGTTILITEHRLDEIIPYSNQVVVMEQGTILTSGTPEEVCQFLHRESHPMLASMPVPVRMWSELEKNETVGKLSDEEVPLTINQGRVWFQKYFKQRYGEERFCISEEENPSGDTVLEVKDVYFKYDKKGEDILSGVSLRIHRGEIFGILGGNGTGKSTLLSILSEINTPYHGKVRRFGKKIALLPQDPTTLFVKKTIYEDLREMRNSDCGIEEFEQQIQMVLDSCDLESIKDSNIYDVSGGERQRAGIAKILLAQPEVLLLDEPTKGMDNAFKCEFGALLKRLTDEGKTIVMVSHDTEFCASFADECAMMFQGEIISSNKTRLFFENNNFYTTATNRIAGDFIRNAIVIEDLSKFFKGTGEHDDNGGHSDSTTFHVIHTNGKPTDTYEYQGINHNNQIDNYKVTKREVLISVFTICILIPLTIYFGVHFLQNQKYLFISLLIIVECMGMFIGVFESRGADSREVVLISVISAIAVAGRLAFYMYPEFKPVMALVIITAIAIGPVNGFIVGAVTMLVSNMVFGQGPWTPWQMFAMGLIGFAAGLIFQGFKKNHLYHKVTGRALIGLYGLFAAVFIYGGIMNPAAAVMSHIELKKGVLLSYYISGFPLDLTQGIATFAFVMLLSGVMIDKIMRVKNKYGV